MTIYSNYTSIIGILYHCHYYGLYVMCFRTWLNGPAKEVRQAVDQKHRVTSCVGHYITLQLAENYKGCKCNQSALCKHCWSPQESNMMTIYHACLTYEDSKCCLG